MTEPLPRQRTIEEIAAELAERLQRLMWWAEGMVGPAEADNPFDRALAEYAAWKEAH
jgi:hypothetical protein